MELKSSYTNGWNISIKTYKNILILYGINFLLALSFSIGFATSSSKSLIYNNLFSDFQFTAFIEFIINYKTYLSILFNQFLWFSVLYMLLNVFILGGILDSFFYKKFDSDRFWKHSKMFFFRYFKQSLYFLILNLVLFVLAFYILSIIFSQLIEKEAIETEFILPFFIVLSIYLILASFLYIISDYTKFSIYFSESNQILKSIWKNTKYFIKNFASVLILFFTFTSIIIFLIIFSLAMNYWINVSNYLSLFLVFLMHQIFVFVRIFLRLWFLSSQFSYFTIGFNKKIENKKAEFEALDEKAEAISQEKFKKEKTVIRQGKDERAQAAIKDINVMLENIQNQISNIEKEARPEIKAQLINNLILASQTEEWEMIEENVSHIKQENEIKRVISILDEIKQEKEKEKNQKKEIFQKKMEDDLFEFDD